MSIESEVYGLSGPQDQFSEPFALQMANALPPAWATAGWNLGRVSKTMQSAGRAGGRGGILEGINQTMNPRYLSRMRRAANIDPTAYGVGSKMYSPFNFMASAGNFMFQKRDSTNVPFVGQRVNSLLGKASGSLSGSLGVEAGEVPFSPGTLGRVMGMSDITRMSDKKFASKALNMYDAIYDLNGGAKAAQITSVRPGSSMLYNKYAMAGEFGSTIRGSVSGKAAGYIHGASAYKAGNGAMAGARAAARGSFGTGVEAGIKAAEEGKFLAKAAPLAGPMLKGVNVASWILLAHDAALGVGKMVGAATRGVIEAGKSTMGSINKPVMGMGFKDNTVAATSRQRGVMAIQNSQLNARSMLGSEGAMMAAHFG